MTPNIPLAMSTEAVLAREEYLKNERAWHGLLLRHGCDIVSYLSLTGAAWVVDDEFIVSYLSLTFDQLHSTLNLMTLAMATEVVLAIHFKPF